MNYKVLVVAVILGMAAILLWLTPARSQTNRVDAAIVFVIDRSLSMGVAENHIVMQGHALAIASYEVVSAIEDGRYGRIAAAVVVFGNTSEVQIGWHIIDSQDSANRFAAAILTDPPHIDTSSTLISTGMVVAHGLLVSLPYQADKVVVDVTGDGDDQNRGLLMEARQAILATGATINGLPLITHGDNDLIDHYNKYVVGGPAYFNLPVRSIEDFPSRIRQKLVLELF